MCSRVEQLLEKAAPITPEQVAAREKTRCASQERQKKRAADHLQHVQECAKSRKPLKIGEGAAAALASAAAGVFSDRAPGGKKRRAKTKEPQLDGSGGFKVGWLKPQNKQRDSMRAPIVV